MSYKLYEVYYEHNFAFIDVNMKDPDWLTKCNAVIKPMALTIGDQHLEIELDPWSSCKDVKKFYLYTKEVWELLEKEHNLS